MSSSSQHGRASSSRASALLELCARRPLRCLAVVLALQASLAGLLLATNYTLGGDSFEYLTLARSLVEGRGFTLSGEPEVYRMPGFPWLVALGARLVPNLELTGHLVAYLCGVLAVAALYWTARAIFSPQQALAAATLLAINGHCLYSSTRALTEAPALLFVTLAHGFLLRSLARDAAGTGAALGFGACSASAYLVRSEALLVFVAGLAWCVLSPANSRARRLLAAAVAVAAFCAVSAPHWLHLHDALGRFSLGQNSVNLIWYHEPPVGPEWTPPDPAWVPDPFDACWPTHTHPASFDAAAFVASEWRELALRWLRNALTFVEPLASVHFFGLALVGLVAGWRVARRRLARWRCVALCLPCVALLAMPFRDGTARLIVPYVGPAFTLTAVALVELLESGGFARRRSLAVLVVVLVLAPLVKYLRYIGRPEEPHHARYRVVAERIRELDGEQRAPVMSDAPEIGFFAARDRLAIPVTNELGALALQMDRHGAELLVVARNKTAKLIGVPELAEPRSNDALELVETFAGEVELYRRR